MAVQKLDQTSLSPFLKWAGGKRALLSEILPRLMPISGRYFEPFLGAGAVLLSMPSGTERLASDVNVELIETYEVIRDEPEQLIQHLSEFQNTKESFLEIRSWDRLPEFRDVPKVKRAARFIFLNKTCFNGLHRVNSKGQFNVPFGNYANPRIFDPQHIRKLSTSFGSDFYLSSSGYLDLTAKVRAGDTVYFDPPYDPISATSSFVGYNEASFNRDDQIKLRDEAVRLIELGAKVLLSNADTPFIRTIYGDLDIFEVEQVSVNRAISANASSRRVVSEVLIRNAS